MAVASLRQIENYPKILTLMPNLTKIIILLRLTSVLNGYKFFKFIQ